MSENELAAVQEALPAAPSVPSGDDPTPGQLIQIALSQGHSIDAVEKLVEMYNRQKDRQAEAAYVRDLSLFRRACPIIPKRGKASFPSKRGGQVEYTYARFEDICETIDEKLAEYGFAFGHSYRVIDGQTFIVCVVSHRDGHRTETPYPCPSAKSDMLSPGQNIAHGVTTAKRHSLVAALGLWACEAPDLDDPIPGAPRKPDTFISEERQNTLNDLLLQAEANKSAFLGWASKTAGVAIGSLAEIPDRIYMRCLDKVEQKIKAKQ